MRNPSARRVMPFVLTVLLLGGATLLVGGSPAQAQCLSESECDALKAQVREIRSEARELRSQIRELKQRIRQLPRGSEERLALRRQLRAVRQEAKQLRRRARPVIREFRQGCRNC